MINAIVKLILALNGNVKKSQLAAGFAWGTLLALIPALNVFWLALFLLSFFFRHNHASKLFTMVILKLLSPVIAPWIDALGWEFLHIAALQPLFTTLYNMPFVPWTKFNNTLVAGGLVGGIALWLPVPAVHGPDTPVPEHPCRKDQKFQADQGPWKNSFSFGYRKSLKQSLAAITGEKRERKKS